MKEGIESGLYLIGMLLVVAASVALFYWGSRLSKWAYYDDDRVEETIKESVKPECLK